MKTIITSLMVVLLTGCSFNQYQKDVADNNYNKTKTYANPSAEYLGEWSATTSVGIRSIKIKDDGRIKVCLSPSSGVSYGKVFLRSKQPAFMLQTGAIAEIISIDKASMLLHIYGKQEKYFAGHVPEECLASFRDF